MANSLSVGTSNRYAMFASTSRTKMVNHTYASLIRNDTTKPHSGLAKGTSASATMESGRPIFARKRTSMRFLRVRAMTMTTMPARPVATTRCTAPIHTAPGMSEPAMPDSSPAAAMMPSSFQGSGWRTPVCRGRSAGRSRKLSSTHASETRGRSAVARMAYGGRIVLTTNDATAATMQDAAPYMSVCVPPIWLYASAQRQKRNAPPMAVTVAAANTAAVGAPAGMRPRPAVIVPRAVRPTKQALVFTRRLRRPMREASSASTTNVPTSPKRMPLSKASRNPWSKPRPGKMDATCVQQSHAMSRPMPKNRRG